MFQPVLNPRLLWQFVEVGATSPARVVLDGHEELVAGDLAVEVAVHGLHDDADVLLSDFPLGVPGEKDIAQHLRNFTALEIAIPVEVVLTEHLIDGLPHFEVADWQFLHV